MASKSAKSIVSSILTNRFVLYAVLFLSVLTIIGYIALSDYLAIGVFVVAGIVATYFTKNMIIILGAAILAAAALGVRGSVSRAVEGMTSGIKSKDAKKDGAGAGSGDDEDADADADGAPAVDPASAPGTTKAVSGTKKPGASTKKQGFGSMTKKLRPAKVEGSGDDLDDDEIIGKRIDYAATIEQAYDHLQSMIGDKGMSGLTSETEKLINQQKTLMETLSTMAPVLESAKSTIGALNMTGLFGGGSGGGKDKAATAASAQAGSNK